MSWVAVAIGGGTALFNYFGQRNQAAADREANKLNAQMSADQLRERARQFNIGTSNRSLDVERRQESEISRRGRENQINRNIQNRFQSLRKENIGALSPYAQAGVGALEEQQALMGLSGQESQKAAMGRFSISPGQQFLRERQEKALLRNASAMGGLGGGNVRTALQEQAFGRAQTDFQNRISRLSSLAGKGQEAAGAGLQAGYAPNRILTGIDKGVAKDTPFGTEAPKAAPPPAPDLAAIQKAMKPATKAMGSMAAMLRF